MKLPNRSALCIALIAIAGAPLANAQDSTSKLNGLPGDALDPYNAAEQLNDYVVDQAALTSTGGKVYGIAPIAKASAQRNTLPLFFTSSFSAQNMSRRVATNVPFLRSSYMLWTGPGFGVNNDPARNDPGTPVNTVGATGFQFGFGFAEFGDGNPSGTSLNNMVGGIANFRTARPSRLFVSRITAAAGGSNEGCSLASFGAGGVDEDGNLHFRADSNLTTNLGCPTFVPVTGNNLFRVRMAARTATVNVLSGNFPTGADAAATDHLLVASTTTHNCPNIIPRSIATRPILIGANAPTTPPGSYVFEQAAGALTTGAPGAHLAGSADQRGGIAYSIHNFPGLFAGTAGGTGGVLGYNSGQANALTIWGLDANGGFLSPISRALPAVITDPDQPTWNNTVQPGTYAFDHYHGATLFRAAPSQVALGRDQAGNLLSAGVVYYGGIANNDPNCFIAVAKLDPISGATTWSVAAWTQNAVASPGKNVYQNGTTVIGTLRPFGILGGLGATGPTQSAPMIDSVGNIWFIGSFELAAAPAPRRSASCARCTTRRRSLPHRSGREVGRHLLGPQLGQNYRIGFIPLAGTTTISIDTAWSGNIAEGAFQNQYDRRSRDFGRSDARRRRVPRVDHVRRERRQPVPARQHDAGQPGRGLPGPPLPEPVDGLQRERRAGRRGHRRRHGDRQQQQRRAGLVRRRRGHGVLLRRRDGRGLPVREQFAGRREPRVPQLARSGSRLTATGIASLSNDTIVLHGNGMPNSVGPVLPGPDPTSRRCGRGFRRRQALRGRDGRSA